MEAAANYEDQLRTAAVALVDAIYAGRALSPSDGVDFAQRAQREFAALEALHLAAMASSGASSQTIRRVTAAGGTRSRKQTNKLTKRAGAIEKNPDIATKLASGELGEEHVDALAEASAETKGEAANDVELISELEDAKPDDAGKVTRKWLERRQEISAQSRYDRQNQRRSASSGYDRSSKCDTFLLRGPREKIQELKKATKARANEMYLADGGRDVPDDQHPRTHQQRMFDAAYELLLAGSLSSSGSCSGPAGCHSDVTGAGSRRSSPVRVPHPRTMTHVAITVDADDEALIRAATLNGDGYLPDSVLERYGCNTIVGGTVFSRKGEVLWHGRQKRYATPSQFAALVARDKGCVLCGQDSQYCEAHHIYPFNAAVQGETNVDELAMVCTSCHHWLHDTKHTLTWTHKPPNAGHRGGGGDADGDSDRDSAVTRALGGRVWSTRPATADEIAPSSPKRVAKGTARQPRSETDRPGRATSPARS